MQTMFYLKRVAILRSRHTYTHLIHGVKASTGYLPAPDRYLTGPEQKMCRPVNCRASKINLRTLDWTNEYVHIRQVIAGFRSGIRRLSDISSNGICVYMNVFDNRMYPCYRIPPLGLTSVILLGCTFFVRLNFYFPDFQIISTPIARGSS